MKKRRLLIVGCGDVARRFVADLLSNPTRARHWKVLALLRHASDFMSWRQRGTTPIAGDLDERRSLFRAARLAQDVVHLAPPPNGGRHDTRTRHLVTSLMATQPSMLPRSKGRILSQRPQRSERFTYRRLVLISTTGVYGNCHGGQVRETRPVAPQTDRAIRRVDQERWVRRLGCSVRLRAARNIMAADRSPSHLPWTTHLLRVPGIYAHDRFPLDRLRAASPVPSADWEPVTSHIHADDLARLIRQLLCQGSPSGRSGRSGRGGRTQRIYNASDDRPMRLGGYFDLLADHFHLPRPPRVGREDALQSLSPLTLSFWNESRSIDNARLRHELRFQLRYPTVEAALSDRSKPRAKAKEI